MPPMLHSRTLIEEGDLVIIFMSRDNMTAINVKRGEHFHNKFGRYKHDDMIGMKFGSKMHSPPPQSGYIHLLRPTPELWTLSLPHRTQILYMPDIAYIIMRLGVRVGGTVLEAGTGSGSMTHSMSRTVGPKGTVHSCEYHRARFEKAGEEFEEHGLDNVRLQHRNVCKDGFGDVEGAEAVFLDLPAPWEAIPHAVKILKTDQITRICCFSPCMEQVLKTATALRAEGFVDVSTQEVLTRTYDLIAPPLQDSHHLASVSAVAADLRDHERRKEERRAQQMRNARERSRAQKAAKEAKEAKEAAAKAGEEAAEGAAGESGKRKLDETDEPADDKAAKVPRVCDSEAAVELEVGGNSAATMEVDADAEAKAEPDADADAEDEDEPVSTQEAYEAEYAARYAEPTTPWGSMVLTKPSPEMRGHTSYLTFATFYPAAIREQIAEQDSVAPTGPVTAVTTEAATREGSERA